MLNGSRIAQADATSPFRRNRDRKRRCRIQSVGQTKLHTKFLARQQVPLCQLATTTLRIPDSAQPTITGVVLLQCSRRASVTQKMFLGLFPSDNFQAKLVKTETGSVVGLKAQDSCTTRRAEVSLGSLICG
jgi:hypothetical protein